MLFLLIPVLIVVLYFLTWFFVVQPIGAIPDGATVRYRRVNTNLPFISSADSISLDRVWSVSLLTRGIALGNIMETIWDKIIMRIPYIESMYSLSVDGAEFDR